VSFLKCNNGHALTVDFGIESIVELILFLTKIIYPAISNVPIMLSDLL